LNYPKHSVQKKVEGIILEQLSRHPDARHICVTRTRTDDSSTPLAEPAQSLDEAQAEGKGKVILGMGFRFIAHYDTASDVQTYLVERN
jgi:hypothetical protein